MQTIQLLTPTEASEIYGIPESELLLLAKSGKIGHYYFGRKLIRFSHDQILKYIDPLHLTEEEEKQLAKKREEHDLVEIEQKRQIQVQEIIESKKKQKEREYEEYCSLERAKQEAIYLFSFIKEGNIKDKLQVSLNRIRSLQRSRYKIDKIEQKKLIYDFNMRIAAIFIKRGKYRKLLKKSLLFNDRRALYLAKYIVRLRNLEASRNRRGKIMASDEIITTKDWIDICERWGNKCLCCDKSGNYLTLTLDHVNPLIDGGQHKKNNIQPLCKSCNCRKGAKYIDY